jgi:hypothetical protein
MPYVNINTLNTEDRVLVSAGFGFFFAGMLLLIATWLIGPMQTLVRVPFFAISWVVSTIIIDIIYKTVQDRSNTPTS